MTDNTKLGLRLAGRVVIQGLKVVGFEGLVAVAVLGVFGGKKALTFENTAKSILEKSK